MWLKEADMSLTWRNLKMRMRAGVRDARETRGEMR